MRTRLRRLYEALEAASPALATLIWRARHGHAFNTVRKHVGGGNSVSTRGALLNHVTIDIRGTDNRVTIAPRCVLNNVHIRVRGNGSVVELGERCVLSEGGDLLIEDDGCVLQVGGGTTFVQAQLAVTEPGSRLTVGKDCMFAYGIEVRTGDSHPIFERLTGERVNPAEDVAIGEHVWVSVGSTILKSVRIADGCVIGAGSVVTGAFDEPGVVIAGNPARVVRAGIRWERERTGR